jgi:protein transport protein SEC39
MELMNTALEEKDDNKEIFDVVRENWITIFQLAKNEYDEPLRSDLLERKLKLLSKLILVTPTEFNTKVLEQWQILHVEKAHIVNSVSDETENGESKRSLLSIADPSLGDVQARLRKSLKSSADELLNSNGADIGKNIIGWIVGANQ